MLKVKRGRGTRRCFSEVLESCHSPLVLVGAPAQGCSSPLIHARIKFSLRADSSTLHRVELPTTAHNLSWVIHKLRRMITELPITTEPSRWWWSPRVTSTNSHLTMTSPMRRVDAHFAILAFTNEGSLLVSQISITSLGPCSSWHSQGCFSTVGMSKSTPSHEWRKYLYTHVQNEPLCASAGWPDAPVKLTGRSG